MNPPSLSSGFDPVDELVEAFLERHRRGERPSLTEYTEQHPELAERIRALFPALLVLEELGSRGGETTGSPADAGALVPQRLGDYLLLRPVGSGGMGVVYEAIQESLGRHVALKTLPFQRLGDATRLERFRREARAAARLHHTHIVPVFGVGEHNGLHYYAMQFIRGHGLDTILHEIKRLRRETGNPAAAEAPTVQDLSTSLAWGLRTGRFPTHQGGGQKSPAITDRQPDLGRAPAEPAPAPLSAASGDRSRLSDPPAAQYLRSVARIGVDVAEALEYAHNQGILHRDIKPSNLLLDAEGQVWVNDFGLAKAQDSDELTRTGDIVGTLRYMAPERFDGWSDPRSDVYALGATLYELLTLRPVFEELDRVKLIEQVLHESPLPLRPIDRQIPRDLETIVLKALAKAPGERYATAGQLAEDLRRFVAGEPIRARRVGRAERAWRWCRRHPGQTALVGTVASLLLGIGIVLPVAALLRAERNVALANLDRASRAEESLRLEQLRTAAAAHLARARAHRFSGQVGQRFKSLEELAAAARIAPTLELRNEAIACLALTDVRLAKPPWEGAPVGTRSFVLDDQFERYARSDVRGNLSIRRLSDDRELMVLPGPGSHAFFLRFSPDGRFLAAMYDKWDPGSMVWDVGNGRPILKQRVRGSLTFSPDSRTVALSPDDWTIRIIDVASGREEKIVPSVPGGHYFAFDPSGRFLAVKRDLIPRSVLVISPLTGEEVRTLPLPADAAGIGWCREARLLAATTTDNRLFVLDFERGTVQSELIGHESRPNSVVFRGSDDLLASTGWDSTLRLWEPLIGRPLLRIEGGGSPPQFRVDAPWLASTLNGTKIELWEVASGGEACRILGGPSSNGPFQSVEFSADGRLLLAASSEGVWLWDWAKARDIAFLPGGRNFATFCPNGDSLLTGGKGGLIRWPIRKDQDKDREGLVVGPPTLLFDSSDVRAIRPMAEGTRIAFADRGRGKVVLTDSTRNTSMVVLGDVANASQVATSPDGQWVAASTFFGTGISATVWDVRKRTLAWQSPRQDEQGDANVRFSPDGQWLVTGTPRAYRFWKVGSWEPGPSIPRDHAGATRGAIAFTRDGAMLAIAQSARLVRLIDVATNRELASLEAFHPGIINDLAFSPDDGQLAVGCEGHEMQVWDMRFLRRSLAAIGLDWEQPSLPSGPTPASQPIRARILPGDLRPAIAAGRIGDEVRRFLGHTDAVTGVAFSPDGRLGIAAGADATIRMWEIETGDLRRVFQSQGGSVNDLAIAPDGRRILSAHSDGTLRLWDVGDGKEIRPFRGHSGEVEAVVVSADGHHALSGGEDCTLRLWDVETGMELRRFDGHTMRVRVVALSPDGRLALSGGADGSMRLWDVTSGREVHQFADNETWVEGIAFSPHGRCALSGGGVGRILRLWDLKTGQVLRHYRGHTAYVQRVAFSPDGRFALSGGADGTLRLWNVETGEELLRFLGHDDTVRGLAFSPDGRYVLSGSLDKTVRLWRLPADLVPARASARIAPEIAAPSPANP
jgi:WD40 repeat protein/serine/threonine protein kinase